MKVGILGLGLIGGSLAKAYKEAGHTLYGRDIDRSIVGYAQLIGTIDGELDEQTLPQCELLLLATTPQAVIEYITAVAPQVSKECLVIDICGIKRNVCATGFALAQKHGFTFAGGHPMAGLQYSGFKYSRANLFQNGSMIVVPPTFDDIKLLDRIKQHLAPMNCKKFIFTTADNHDRMIAYTSQLCHVVSNAFVKSPTAQEHRGYSAGSYRDLTRVARLNEKMWTELFLENREHLLNEINLQIDYLTQYRDAIESRNADTLCRLLQEGRIAKEQSES